MASPDIPEIGANASLLSAFDVFNEALNHRPEITLAKLRIESAKEDLQMAEGEKLPSIDLYAQYYNNYNNKFKYINGNLIPFDKQLTNNDREAIGVRINIPIFNRFVLSNNVKKAQLQVESRELQLEIEKKTLRENIQRSYSNALSAHQKYIAAQKANEATGEAFEMSKQKFDLGAISTFDYNQAKTNKARTEINLINAKYEFIFATKVLDFYRGIPFNL